MDSASTPKQSERESLSVLLCGFGLDDERFAEIAAKSPILLTQTQTFASNLRLAIASTGAEVGMLSFSPVQDYPAYPQIVFHGRRFREFGRNGQELGFINLLGLKHLTRSYILATRGISVVRLRPPSAVVVHGVHTPWLRFALEVRKRFGSRTIAVLTDAPRHTAGDGGVRRKLHEIDRALVRRLLRDFDGVAALTEGLARDYAPDVPSIVFPGFLSEGVPEPKQNSSGEIVVAYAGGLSEAYGVGDLVRAVRGIECRNIRLRIFGSGDLSDWLKEQATADTRISYEGVVDRRKLLDELSGASLLVNPRRLTFEGAQHSFPSKLLEYLSLGVPTLSTPLPAIDPDLRGHLVMAVGEGDIALREAIEAFGRRPQQERSAFGLDARRWARSRYSHSVIGSQLQSLWSA